ncbi:MAG: hypothetical protein ACOCRK_01625 [bacterium]
MKISVRLRPDKDDSLKDWYLSLPEGDRSRIVRNVLKEYAEAGQAEVLDYKTTIKRDFINVETQLDNVKFKEKDIKNEDNEKVLNSKLDNLIGQF